MQGHRIGYVRVSSFDQNPERQLEQAQVERVFTDKASGTHVKYFFVKPEHHRQGIGKSLWAFALKAVALGESLSVRSSLFAVPAYECLGFINTGIQQEFKGMHFQAMSAQLSVLRCRL